MTIRSLKTSKEIQKFINEGASVKNDEDSNEWTFVSLHIPKQLLYKLDEIKKELRKTRFGLTRNTLILECIHAKLISEKK